MDEKKKRLIFLVGSIFVAVIFLTSYAAFSNNNSSSSSTSTIKNTATFFSLGNSNAVITNYSYIAFVTLPNDSNSLKANFTGLMTQLEDNGSIQSYTYSNGSYQIVLSTISAYGLQQMLYKQTATNSIRVGATTDVMLPESVTLYYTNVPIKVSPPGRNYSLYMDNVESVGTTINVSISALILRNGSIYNGQFRVGYAGPATKSNSNANTITNSISSNAIPSNSLTSNSVSNTQSHNSIANNSLPSNSATSNTPSNTASNSIANAITTSQTTTTSASTTTANGGGGGYG